MGRIPNGIMGDMIGTVGNVSGYVRFGTNFVRAKRRKSSRPMSLKRLAQQQKIKVCNDFTRPFSGQNFFIRPSRRMEPKAPVITAQRARL